ncbi:MAG: hypothetical protein E6G51_03465 [Actinobacteria bacterium]|nr:MAG: hypothetical protein E6G51_03465 [Actinomycetota bacterium]
MIPRTAVALLVAMALLIAPGCGSEDSSTGAGTQAATEAAAESPGVPPTPNIPKPTDGFNIPGEENPAFGFFREATPGQRRAVSKGLEAYMKAREAGDWETMCLFIAPRTKAVIHSEVANRPELKGAKCEEIVAALAGPAAGRKNNMTGPIDSARWAFNRALALYHGVDGNDYVMQMLIHYGDWEVGALAPEELE